MEELERLTQEFEKFQKKIEGFRQQAVDAEAMGKEVAELETRATAPDGTVTVVAGPGGSIKDIQFGKDARKHGDAQLSSVVMATLRQAVAASAHRQAAIVERYAGPGLGVLDRVMEVQQQEFAAEQRRPAPMPASPPPAPRPQGPAPEPHDDDQGPILRKGGPRRDNPQSGQQRSGNRGVMRNLGHEEGY